MTSKVYFTPPRVHGKVYFFKLKYEITGEDKYGEKIVISLFLLSSCSKYIPNISSCSTWKYQIFLYYNVDLKGSLYKCTVEFLWNKEKIISIKSIMSRI